VAENNPTIPKEAPQPSHDEPSEKNRSALAVACTVFAAAADSQGHTYRPRAPILELSAPTLPLGSIPFPEAAKAWLLTRQHHIAPRTYLDYERHIETLSRFFRHILLRDITDDSLREYQYHRRQNVGPGMVNKECGVVCMMRNRIGQSFTDYQPLPLPKDYESPGRALTTAEETKLERVFRAAADHPHWKTAALVSLLSMKCGAGPGELLSLSLKDVGLDPPHITIPRRGAKRISRERSLELNEEAAWALERLIRRAIDECKCTLPEHYLIPRRNTDHSYDPTQPAQGWRSGLDKLLSISDIKIRRYDFRHHAVSVALSNPSVPLEAARAYFGWMSPKMVQRYYHVNQAAMRVVAAALDKKPDPPKTAKPKRKAPVVEIVTRPAMATRYTTLFLPAAVKGGTMRLAIILAMVQAS
jgi:integrase